MILFIVSTWHDKAFFSSFRNLLLTRGARFLRSVYVIYYMANWSMMKRSNLVGSLNGPNFSLRTAKMDRSWTCLLRRRSLGSSRNLVRGEGLRDEPKECRRRRLLMNTIRPIEQKETVLFLTHARLIILSAKELQIPYSLFRPWEKSPVQSSP